MMTKTTLAPLLLAAVPAASIGYQLTSSDATLAALSRLETSSSLSTLRAGAPATHTLAELDRAELKRADRTSGHLVDMRGGEFTDHELLIIGLTALAIVLLIIIL